VAGHPIGGGRTTPLAWGWLRPPQTGLFRVAEATPRPLGVVRPPSLGKFFFLIYLSLGVEGGRTTPKGQQCAFGRTTPKGQQFFFFFFSEATPDRRSGVAKATLWPLGVVQPPPKAKDFSFFFFFFFFFSLCLGGGWTIPNGHRWVWPAGLGWLHQPPGQQWWSGHPIGGS
jgi:hypothetical protein